MTSFRLSRNSHPLVASMPLTSNLIKTVETSPLPHNKRFIREFHGGMSETPLHSSLKFNRDIIPSENHETGTLPRRSSSTKF